MSNYGKPILTLDQQIALLKARGLAIDKNNQTIWYLTNVGYYRLSIYAKVYQDIGDLFYPGITFDHLVELYEFDKRLRSIIIEYLEIIENSFKSTMIRILGEAFGSFRHLDPQLFKNNSHLQKIHDIVDKNKDHITIKHFYQKYSSPQYPPIWMVLQVASFGEAVAIYRCLIPKYQIQISTEYGLYFLVFENRLRCLGHMRNVCAHHDRLWNRVMTGKIMTNKNNYTSLFLHNDSIEAYLIVMVVLLKHIASDPKRIIRKIDKLLQKHPNILTSHMRLSSNRKTKLSSVR